MTATKNYHHEEHEVHEEERGKEALHDYDCPCNQGKTKLSSHPDFFCAFAPLRAIHQQELIPGVTGGRPKTCKTTIASFFVRFVVFVVKILPGARRLKRYLLRNFANGELSRNA